MTPGYQPARGAPGGGESRCILQGLIRSVIAISFQSCSPFSAETNAFEMLLPAGLASALPAVNALASEAQSARLPFSLPRENNTCRKVVPRTPGASGPLPVSEFLGDVRLRHTLGPLGQSCLLCYFAVSLSALITQA